MFHIYVQKLTNFFIAPQRHMLRSYVIAKVSDGPPFCTSYAASLVTVSDQTSMRAQISAIIIEMNFKKSAVNYSFIYPSVPVYPSQRTEPVFHIDEVSRLVSGQHCY